MKNVACPCCSSVDQVNLIQGRDRLLNLDCEAHLVCCTYCGTIYQNPQLDQNELAPHYPSNYHPFTDNPWLVKNPVVRWLALRGTTQRVSHVMRAHSQTGKLLDIGCATGIFLKSMQNIGWVTAGVETNAHAAEIARAEHGLDVRHGELRNNMFPPDYFDVVTMWDVLEHVSEPRITLGLIAESLVPGGWLLLRIPNPQGLEKRIFGNNWSGWDVPRHLTLFSEATLNTVLIETGFEPRWRAGSSGQFAMLALSIRYFLASRNFKNSLFLKMFRGVPGLVMQLALSPLLWLLNISKQSSVMTIAAQKIAR